MNIFLVGFAILVLDMLFTVVEAVRNAKVDEDGNRKGKIRWPVVMVGLVGAIATLLFGVYDLPLKDPMLRVREPDSVYFYSEPDENEAWVSIEYSLNFDDTSAPEWTAYNTDESIKITNNPTKIYYRTRFLWRTTDTQSQTAFIDDYDRVFLDADFAPDITYKSIAAEYDARTTSADKEGNTYTGYKMTEHDFVVKGIDKNGIEHQVDGYTFSPEILKEGRNEIEVSYTTSSGQNLSDTVVVTAFAPKLTSITANLKEEYQRGVLVGTTLSTGMFEVMGTYENDGKEEITDFLIEPEEVLDEGDFEATINKDGVKDEVSIHAVSEFSAKESERNNDVDNADDIGVNTSCSGTLATEEDVDYYKLAINGKGKAFLRFKHSKIDDTDVYWNVGLLTKDNEDPILSIESNGASATTESNAIRLGAGTYYVRVSCGNRFDNREYVLSVQFEEEDDTFETEYNDDLDSATVIKANTDAPYTGNLSYQTDVDYYKFSVADKGKMSITLSHAKKDDDYIGWHMQVMDNTDRALASMVSKGGESEVHTPGFRVSSGEYYVKIERENNWSNLDYQISVDFVQEGNEAETEPNDDFTIATKITNGQTIKGNIQSENDTDIYVFDYDGNGDLKLSFAHERFDNGNRCWEARLFSKDSSKPLNTEGGSDYIYITGDDAEVASYQWKDLEKTTYYIKVQKASFCSYDYSLSVNW